MTTPRRREVPRRLQATVRTYEPGSRSGTVLLDDGRELSFDGDALDGSRLRLLRLGQRVRLQVESGRVIRLTIATLPDE